MSSKRTIRRVLVAGRGGIAARDVRPRAVPAFAAGGARAGPARFAPA